MPFWSDWLRFVARPQVTAVLSPPAASGPLELPADAHASAPRRADEPAHERRVARAVVREPRPSVRVPASPAMPAPEREDVALPDCASVPRRAADEREPLDEIGSWHVRVFELLGDGVLLFGEDGVLAYRNAAAMTMTDDEGMGLLREARALALAVTARGAGAGHRASGAGATRALTVGAVRFHLAAVPIPASLPRAGLAPASCEPAVLVTIARTSPALPTSTVLRHRFQLTAREASVALLLAEGRSNASVARRLGISANTVRHYIEAVLLKLDVPSRAAVAAALLGVYERTDEHPLPRGGRGRAAAAPD